MHVKVFPFTLLVVVSLSCFGQNNYFQQKTNYQIAATLNTEAKTISGWVAVDYYNASPDTLTFIWFHIWAKKSSGIKN
jgi:hypothetical protein